MYQHHVRSMIQPRVAKYELPRVTFQKKSTLQGCIDAGFR